MSSTLAGWLQASLLVGALVACYRPLGDYMAHVLTTPKHLWVERGLYRVVGVDADADQRWPVYLRSVLAFSVVGILFLYGFQRLQSHLLLSVGMAPIPPAGAFNTAISFVTNT